MKEAEENEIKQNFGYISKMYKKTKKKEKGKILDEFVKPKGYNIKIFLA